MVRPGGWSQDGALGRTVSHHVIVPLVDAQAGGCRVGVRIPRGEAHDREGRGAGGLERGVHGMSVHDAGERESGNAHAAPQSVGDGPFEPGDAVGIGCLDQAGGSEGKPAGFGVPLVQRCIGAVPPHGECTAVGLGLVIMGIEGVGTNGPPPCA